MSVIMNAGLDANLSNYEWDVRDSSLGNLIFSRKKSYFHACALELDREPLFEKEWSALYRAVRLATIKCCRMGLINKDCRYHNENVFGGPYTISRYGSEKQIDYKKEIAHQLHRVMNYVDVCAPVFEKYGLKLLENRQL